jgi:hypothetical protein
MKSDPKRSPAAKLGEWTTVMELPLVTNSGREVATAKRTNPIRVLVICVFSEMIFPYIDNL